LINKLVFLLQESLVSIVRTKVPSIVSSLAIAVSLLVLSIAYCLFISFENLTLKFKDRYSIEVFFLEDIQETQVIAEFNKILLFDGIEEGIFINKVQAANIFKQEFDEDILDIIGSNPLPFSAIYTISELDRDYKSIKEITKKINLIESVDVAVYEKDAIIKFDKLIKNIIAFIFAISFFIFLVVVFFVSNTILLVIYSKKEAIEIYKLLGASNIFIKIPYLIEGIIYGLVGAVVSIISLYLLYGLTDYFLSSLLKIKDYDFIKIIILNFSAGIFLGFLGSSKALASYVKN